MSKKDAVLEMYTEIISEYLKEDAKDVKQRIRVARDTYHIPVKYYANHRLFLVKEEKDLAEYGKKIMESRGCYQKRLSEITGMTIEEAGAYISALYAEKGMSGKEAGPKLKEDGERKTRIDSGTVITIAALAIGLAAGKSGIAAAITDMDFDLAMCVLYVLLISVGLGTGLRPGLKEMIKSIRPSILLLPICSIIFTLAFCAVASLAVRDWSLWDCLAVGSGMGYYSLSSVLIASLKEAGMGVTLATALGAMALLTNIFRELMTLVLTPLMARHMGPYAPVAAAGATAMDVCLPGILKSCGPDIIPAALVSGVLSDFSVPFLVSFFSSL